MYVYEGHMGDLFVLDYQLGRKEGCWFFGTADDRDEAWELLKDSGYDHNYVQQFISENWSE